MSQKFEHLLAEYVEQLPTARITEPVLLKGKKPGEKPPKEEYRPMRFGGLDLAKRVDHSALIILKLESGILKQEAHRLWPHVNYSTVASDTLRYNMQMPMELIGFDRSGVGDAASELFDKSSLPLSPVVSSMNTKIDIIHVVRSLFQKGLLKVDKATELPTQIEEQEETVSKAGNMLYSHPSKRHDDMFWALGYACYVAVPFMINMAPVGIQQGTDGLNYLGERNIDDEIDAIMNGYSSNRF